MTVAVVDAFDQPTAEADLAVYRNEYGLPPCTTANGCFRKVDEDGGTSYPGPDAGWGLEISLDLDMVSAACPSCNILLVEAATTQFSDLGTAVDTAVSLGAVAVSNSYGGPEWSSEADDDMYYNHPGVAITVATGDCGYDCAPSSDSVAGTVQNVEYPAASQYVVAVGGTTLTHNSSARGWTESAWGHGGYGAGSGCSLYEPKPSWQKDTGCSMRTEADVSAVADPSTGVAAYDTTPASRVAGLERPGRHERGLADHRRHVCPGRRPEAGHLPGQLSLRGYGRRQRRRGRHERDRLPLHGDVPLQRSRRL